jgi:hypothetical protein
VCVSLKFTSQSSASVEIIGRIETYGSTRCSDCSRRGYDLAFILSSYLT